MIPTGGCGMDLIEFNTHSFIVKIWLEEPADDDNKGKWRGHITHVPDGERRYLKGVGEIADFIVPYLASMGVQVDALSRLRAALANSASDHEPVSESHRNQPIEG